MTAETCSNLVRLRRDGAIAELTLNRAAAANSLSRAMLAALERRMTAPASDTTIRVVVQAAAGRLFSAGIDLKEARVASPARVHATGAFRGPVIVKVRGVASAAGLELVLACDLAYAAATARFATPGINVGMWCATPMVPLLRMVAPRHGAEMLIRENPIDATWAERIGLINRQFPDDELDDGVSAIARELAARSPFTLALGKRALREQLDATLADAYARALALVETNAAHSDAAEGMTAFAEKRPARWSS